MGHKLVTWIQGTFEDIALLVGVLSVSAGVGIRFGIGSSLIAFGALLIAYGVWITVGRR
jgi:hypothetical protein